jgi:RimJ/RimL family protein N-acetyltransferase
MGKNFIKVFETERLLVRHYTIGDADNFFILNGDPEVMRYIRPVKSKEETTAFLKEVVTYSEINPAFGRMAVIEKQSAAFVGSFAIIPLEKTEFMQIGYALLPMHWGKGFATELVRYGLDYIRENELLNDIFAVTEDKNVHSQRVLLKTGFAFQKIFEEGGKTLHLYYRSVETT